MSALPDSTWSDWSAPRQGHEISLRDLEPSRYFQWRAELESASEKSPEVHAVEISYLQSNQPPQLDELAVLEPGQILVPSNFNPAEPGVRARLSQSRGDLHHAGGDQGQPGTRSRSGSAASAPCAGPRATPTRTSSRSPSTCGARTTATVGCAMEDELEDERYSFDATVLPDGLYRFRGHRRRTPAATTAPRERPRRAPARRW